MFCTAMECSCFGKRMEICELEMFVNLIFQVNSVRRTSAMTEGT